MNLQKAILLSLAVAIGALALPLKETCRRHDEQLGICRAWLAPSLRTVSADRNVPQKVLGTAGNVGDGTPDGSDDEPSVTERSRRPASPMLLQAVAVEPGPVVEGSCRSHLHLRLVIFSFWRPGCGRAAWACPPCSLTAILVYRRMNGESRARWFEEKRARRDRNLQCAPRAMYCIAGDTHEQKIGGLTVRIQA